MENLLSQWAEREPAEAMEWIHAQPKGESKEHLLARSAFVLARSDPFVAASQVAEALAPGPLQDEAVLSVLHRWVRRDVESALRWAEGFPDGALRQRALEEIRNAAAID